MSLRHFPLWHYFVLFSLLVIASQAASAQQMLAPGGYQPPVESYVSAGTFGPESAGPAASSNQMLWQQYQALQMGGGQADCQSCGGNGTGGYNRCGCSEELFPWNKGPGNCDQWCVGPKWGVDVGGLMMFRGDADWGRVTNSLGGVVQPVLTDQFEHGPGGRIFVTGYNDSGYGIQVGYEGINDWDASLEFAPDAFVVGETREFTYQSRLNSVEINFLPNVASPWKVFSGFRYVQLDEDFIDLTRETRPFPAADTTETVTDRSLNRLLENRLFGLQLGGRRDAWQFGNRITLQTFANAGVYCNKFRRDNVDLTVTTTLRGDDSATTNVTELTESSSSFRTSTRDNLTEIAFVGEAGVAATWRLNPCTALRAGYQILALDGVGTGLEASFTPGLNAETLVYHGLQFGLEYRR